MNLLEDFTLDAQCTVIESNVEEKTNQITATVIVKRGTLKADDIFVSGVHDGKVRQMVDDQHKTVNKAFPGQAIHMTGFKAMPEVGSPLYCVKTLDEAKAIVTRVELREKNEAMKIKAAHDDTAIISSMKHNREKLHWTEKKLLKGGDQTVLYK